MKRSFEQQLDVFEMISLRRILGVTRRDRLCNDIKKPLHLQKEVNYRTEYQHLRYFGHVMRMNDGSYPKTALLGGVHGIRQRGSPQKCWTDNIKEDCGPLGMIITRASRSAQDRKNRRTINGLPMH